MGTTKTERNKIMTSSMGSQGPGWQPPGFSPGQAVISTSTVEISISCSQLEDMDVFSKSDPFCVLYVKDSKSKQWHCFGKTETIDNTLEPHFEKKFILQYKFEERQVLKFEVYDSDSDSTNLEDHDLIGSMECSLGEVVTQQGKGFTKQLTGGARNKKQTITVTSEELISNKEHLNLKISATKLDAKNWWGLGSSDPFLTISKSGEYGQWTVVHRTEVLKRNLNPTFLDYISNGTELSFTVAIDFTGSNGNPQDPRSLHYNDPTGAPNQYITAIKAVGDIIQDYDSDKLFPALGFGAKVPPSGQVSHEFFLNLTQDPYCSGVDGILAAYHQSLNSVQLYGPTNLSPVINHVANFARAYQHDPSNYFVLLIITDGIITDLDATKKAVIYASDLPLSIIIVGVGSEDFSAMDELDSDDQLLTHNGQTAKRDIVQFVEIQKFVMGSTWSKEALAQEVLAEIPDQLVSYMQGKKFKPLHNK